MRSIAIWVMLLANSAPYLFPSNLSFSLRLICSVAAPLFLFLAGYSLGFKKSTTKKTQSQGLYILVSAVFVDVLAWGIPPFITFDVLYVIGFSLIYFELTKKINQIVHHVVFGLVLVSVYFVIQNYRFSNPEPSWSSLLPDLKRLLIDGWFPLIPWIIFPILGKLVFNYRQLIDRHQSSILALFTLGTLVGILTCYHFKSDQLLREGYTELFYPADYYYLLFAVSFCILLYALIQRMKKWNTSASLILLLGRHSLFVYILHCFLIGKIIANFNFDVGITNIALVLILFYVTVYISTYLLERSLNKGYLQPIPNWLKKSLGLY